MSVHELRAALEDRKCKVAEVERLEAPSPLPTPESFMDTLDPIYRSFPTYRSLDEHLAANCNPACGGSSPLDQGGRAGW